MRLTTLLLLLAALTIAAYYLARRRSLALAGGSRQIRRLHSLPRYYGYYAGLWCALPALLALALWLAVSDSVISARVVAGLPEALRSQPPEQVGLVLNDIRTLASASFPRRWSPAFCWPWPLAASASPGGGCSPRCVRATTWKA